MFIQPLGFVLGDPRRDHFGFPSACRGFEALELRENRGQRIRALHARARQNALPFAQEAQKISGSDRLDFRPQPFHGVTMNSRQQTPLAPFFARLLAGEAATHRETLSLQRDQRGVDLRLVQPEGVSNLRGRDGTQSFQPAAHDVDQRVLQRCK